MRSLLLHLIRAQRGLACVLRSGLGAFGQVFGLNSQLSPVACFAPIIAPSVFPVHPLSIRLVPGPPRSAHFVYGGDQYEQALWPSAWLCWRSNAALDGDANLATSLREYRNDSVQHMCYPASIALLDPGGADEPSTARFHRWTRRRGSIMAGLGVGAAGRPRAAHRRVHDR